MALEDLLAQTEARFKKAIDALKHDVASVRTGRAAPSLFGATPRSDDWIAFSIALMRLRS